MRSNAGSGMLLGTAGLFAIAMAYVEAAVVVYLRRLHGVEDLMADRAVLDPFVAAVETGREAATLVMLLALGFAAGRSRQSRLGIAFFAFGVWDIFYYVWLRTLLGWPASLLDPDILFLIPLPWWGPVLAPVLVALLMAAGGAAAVLHDGRGRRVRPRAADVAAAGAGALAILYAFMADALAALPASYEALARMQPAGFNWPLYLAGLAAIGWAAWRAVLSGPARPVAPPAGRREPA
jgi:hypothetical protein